MMAARVSALGRRARIDGTWRSSGQIIIFLNDIPARATPQSRVGMTSGNEHQYLQGDGSASSPARNGFCFRLMHLVLQAPRMPAKPRIDLKRTPHALSGQCRLLAALFGRSCSKLMTVHRV